MSDEKNALVKIAEASANLQEAGMKHVANVYEALPGGAKINNLIVESCDKAAPGTLNSPMCKAFKAVVDSRSK